MRSLIGILLAAAMFASVAVRVATAQHIEVKLWPNGAPGADPNPVPETVRITPDGEHVVTHVSVPSITLYLPASGTATGVAVVIALGGGHSEIWIDHEGYAVAEWLSHHGVAAFVLKYRLAREKGSRYTVEGTELDDMQRALRLVRSRSKEWGVDPDRLGVMGFSAGGELAALASTRYDSGISAGPDQVDHFSSKPAVQALLYPAIPHDPRLTSETPPAFLACGGNDRADISQGLAEVYLALARLHVPAELHIYAGVGHGFGLRKSNPEPVADWPALFLKWVDTEGLLKR